MVIMKGNLLLVACRPRRRPLLWFVSQLICASWVCRPSRHLAGPPPPPQTPVYRVMPHAHTGTQPSGETWITQSYRQMAETGINYIMYLHIKYDVSTFHN